MSLKRNRGLAAVLMAGALGLASETLVMTVLPASAAAPSPEATAPDTSLTAPALAVDPAAPAAPADSAQRFRERIREHLQNHREAMDRHLTADQVRDIVAGRLAMAGNPNLKVGKVTTKEENVVAVDIVTKTGALVSTREVSTKTGGPARFEKMREQRRATMEQRRAAKAGGSEQRTAEAGRPEHGPRHDMKGPGMMGPDMGHGGMRPGMMRGGPGGAGSEFALGTEGPRDLNLTADQAKKLAEARLITLGNPHLKVGAVKEKDADTISVDIVAADNSLVVQHEIDRHNGRMKRDHARG